MTQLSHPINELALPDSAGRLSRCLRIAHQVQMQFIRASDNRACFKKLLSALRIETESKAVFMAEIGEEPGDGPMLHVLAASGSVAIVDPGDAVWSSEVGAAISPTGGPLRRAIDTGQTVVEPADGASRFVMAIPLHNEDLLVGLIGLTGRSAHP